MRTPFGFRGGAGISCTSSVIGQWSNLACTGSVAITSGIETISIPSGNPGSINMHRANNGGTVQYQKNSGAWTSLTINSDNVATFANGDTLKFRETISQGCNVAQTDGTGTVKDGTTGIVLDVFDLTWASGAPGGGGGGG